MIESLQNIGLNEKEARGYLALLPLRNATAYMVALRSGLKKPTAYVVLESLVNKGFVFKMPAAEKTLYIAKSPKDCMSIAVQKIRTAQETLPELMAMQKENEEKVSVAYFEGMDGVKEMYTRLIKDMKKKPVSERKVVGFYAHQQDTSEMLQEYWINLNESFAHHNISRKSITTKHESVKQFLSSVSMQKYLMQVRTISEKSYSSNISIEVYDNFVQIISHRYLQGILIENPDVASVMIQIFNLVWNISEKK